MPAPSTLRVSINRRLINKNLNAGKIFSEGWQNEELTAEELAQLIGKGYAYSVQVKGGVRRKVNFLASDVVSVDIDKGMRIEEALAHAFCQQYLTILYRTPSHTDECHRFRLVFALERTIMKASDQRALNRALAMRLGGDLNATDPVRINFGSDLRPAEVIGGYIPNPVIDELISEGRLAPQADTYGGAASARHGAATSCQRTFNCKPAMAHLWHWQTSRRIRAFIAHTTWTTTRAHL